MSYLQYEHPCVNALHNAAIFKFLSPNKTRSALEDKGKAKNKIIPRAFYQAPAFMAKSKGHVSPAASERGNYPFPVREQQMIASYGGAFSGAEICQLEGEEGLIFWQLHIYFYYVFFTGHLLCVCVCFFPFHMSSRRASAVSFLCL